MIIVCSGCPLSSVLNIFLCDINIQLNKVVPCLISAIIQKLKSAITFNCQ